MTILSTVLKEYCDRMTRHQLENDTKRRACLSSSKVARKPWILHLSEGASRNRSGTARWPLQKTSPTRIVLSEGPLRAARSSPPPRRRPRMTNENRNQCGKKPPKENARCMKFEKSKLPGQSLMVNKTP